MPRNMLDDILQNLRLCDNEQLDKYDKLSKLRPAINKIFKALFQQIQQIHRMTPCYGTHSSRQRKNNKSIQEEYKI